MNLFLFITYLLLGHDTTKLQGTLLGALYTILQYALRTRSSPNLGDTAQQSSLIKCNRDLSIADGFFCDVGVSEDGEGGVKDGEGRAEGCPCQVEGERVFVGCC